MDSETCVTYILVYILDAFFPIYVVNMILIEYYNFDCFDLAALANIMHIFFAVVAGFVIVYLPCANSMNDVVIWANIILAIAISIIMFTIFAIDFWCREKIHPFIMHKLRTKRADPNYYTI